MTDLRPFKNLVQERCGLSFEDNRENVLAQGIRQRMEKQGISSPDAYLDQLRADGSEFLKLVNHLTINETYFFREPAHFSVLTERLLPDLIAARQQDQKVRIVSAGCSTGEEPYTIAMALRDKYGPGFSRRFSIAGFDIDAEALTTARKGVYAGHSFRGVPDRIRESYFEREGDRYRIRQDLRESVLFLQANLRDERYPEQVRGADVIFYRNVSIYFQPEVQHSIFRGLAGLLNDKGYLFLSSTETFFHNIGVLSLVEKDGMFLYSKCVELPIEERRQRGGKESVTAQRAALPKPLDAATLFGTRPAAMAVPASPPQTASESGKEYSPARARDASHRGFDESLALAERKKYDDALRIIEPVVNQQPSFTKARMLKAGILINLRRLDEAEAECRASLAQDRWNLEGHLLLGMIARFRDDLAGAQKAFREAVYIRSSCWIAHFSLGEIYRFEGDAERACREFEIVMTLLAGKSRPEHGLTLFTLSVSAEQIAHLCGRNLALLKRGGN